MGFNIEKIRNELSVEAREARNDGNPNSGRMDQELGRAGRSKTPDELPMQDTVGRDGKLQQGNVTPGEFISSTVDTGGVYKLGPPMRPDIRHDAGFSNFPKESPTWSDRIALVKWYGMLEGGEVLRSDLTDGLAAYRHFLEGDGAAKTFSYDRYVNNDASGRQTFRNAVLEAQDAAITIWEEHGQTGFNFTGPAIPCGSKLDSVGLLFPYPATENWAKAIGAHTIWLSGDVSVVIQKGEEPEFSMVMALHAEDQYNFNPGASDIATGISDDANGRFVIVGWAHGYRHTAILRRTFAWRGTELGVSSLGISGARRRQRQDSANRRGRNRI